MRAIFSTFAQRVPSVAIPSFIPCFTEAHALPSFAQSSGRSSASAEPRTPPSSKMSKDNACSTTLSQTRTRDGISFPGQMRTFCRTVDFAPRTDPSPSTDNPKSCAPFFTVPFSAIIVPESLALFSSFAFCKTILFLTCTLLPITHPSSITLPGPITESFPILTRSPINTGGIILYFPPGILPSLLQTRVSDTLSDVLTRFCIMCVCVTIYDLKSPMSLQ